MMTNTQLYFAIGLPMLLLMGSMASTCIAVSGIRESVREIREDIHEIRSDVKLLTGKVYELMGQKP